MIFFPRIMLSILTFLLLLSSTLTDPISDDDPNAKVIFTKFIKSGRLEEARRRSLVTDLTPNITSYSGFFTVNESCDSNLYFWFFPSQNNPQTDPVAVWLNGGPGMSSLMGLFLEIGPYRVGPNNTLELREYSWDKNASLIFIDNPVGTGFSYTTRFNCFATDQVQIAKELMIALEQFFQVFPEYEKNDLFLVGQSFAGHYIPALAHAILISNSTMNLKGVAIGNGFVDPINQANYAEYLCQLGFIDNHLRRSLEIIEDVARKLIDQNKYRIALEIRQLILERIMKKTDQHNLFNYMTAEMPFQSLFDVFTLMRKREVRQAIHVGLLRTWDFLQEVVYDRLSNDIMKSYRPSLETVADHYRVLIYSGQLDITVAYPLTQRYLKEMKWKYADEFRSAPRKIWKVGNDVAGYVKSSSNFTDVLVRNAGHSVPTDQPAWAFDLINKFFRNQPIVD